MARSLGVLFVLGVLATDPSAQRRDPDTSGAKEPEIVSLTLEKNSAVEHGTVGAVQGTVDQAGRRLLVENLDVLQPVAVILLASDKSHDVRLQVSKVGRTAPGREATTKGQGQAIVRLRTQGDLQIVVQSPSPEPVPFGLVVWAGEERKVDLPDVMIPIKNE